MYRCSRCNAEFRDGAQCSVCQGCFDFPCAGITEGGYRKLGDRKNTWKCSSCKSISSACPLSLPGKVPSAKSPVPTDLESIGLELKRLSSQMASLPTLMTSLKAIQADIADLKTMQADIADLKLIKPELCEMKSSIEFVQHSVETLSTRMTAINSEVQVLHKTKEEMQLIQKRFADLERNAREGEQRSRLNNIEIKGVPMSPSENLFDVVNKLGEQVKYIIPKEQINYVARIPMRNDKVNKTIIVSVHSRYVKENFVAAAKKCTIIPANLGLKGDSNRIFINDHLTLENKMLLNKTKSIAKERGFAFVWVKGCKIFARKNPTSNVISIQSELDLKKFT